MTAVHRGHWFTGPGRASIDNGLQQASRDVESAVDALRSAGKLLDKKADEVSAAQAKWAAADLAYRLSQVFE